MVRNKNSILNKSKQNKKQPKGRLDWKKGLKATQQNEAIVAAVRWLADK